MIKHHWRPLRFDGTILLSDINYLFTLHFYKIVSRAICIGLTQMVLLQSLFILTLQNSSNRLAYLRIQCYPAHHGILVGHSVCPGRLALQHIVIGRV